MNRVFVYGTLRLGEPNYWWALHGKFDSVHPATLAHARMWNNGSYPFLTLDGNPDDVAHGDLFMLKTEHVESVFEGLDRLEGYRPGRADNLYDRKTVTVQTPTGPMDAWVYVTASGYAGDVTARLRRISGGNWLDRLAS